MCLSYWVPWFLEAPGGGKQLRSGFDQPECVCPDFNHSNSVYTIYGKLFTPRWIYCKLYIDVGFTTNYLHYVGYTTNCLPFVQPVYTACFSDSMFVHSVWCCSVGSYSPCFLLLTFLRIMHEMCLNEDYF